MNQITNLVNQHILEWESRLGHIDDMTALAHELHGHAPEGSALHTQLAEINMYREQLSLDLVDAQSHAEGGVRGALEATGLQLERILGSVLGVDAPRRRKTDPTDEV